MYSATEAAVRSFARTWTTDLKARKIRVNVISPGVVPTEGYRALGNEEQLKQYAAQMAALISSAVWVSPTKSLRRSSSWLQMTAALWPAPSWWWMVE